MSFLVTGVGGQLGHDLMGEYRKRAEKSHAEGGELEMSEKGFHRDTPFMILSFKF